MDLAGPSALSLLGQCSFEHCGRETKVRLWEAVPRNHSRGEVCKQIPLLKGGDEEHVQCLYRRKVQEYVLNGAKMSPAWGWMRTGVHVQLRAQYE